MYFLSRELIYLIRAILFGVATGFAVFVFFFYFKPFCENTFKVRIDIDIWWWSGVATSVIAAIVAALLLI